MTTELNTTAALSARWTKPAAVLAGVISYAGYMLMFFGGGRRSQNPLGAIGALLMIIGAVALVGYLLR